MRVLFHLSTLHVSWWHFLVQMLTILATSSYRYGSIKPFLIRKTMFWIFAFWAVWIPLVLFSMVFYYGLHAKSMFWTLWRIFQKIFGCFLPYKLVTVLSRWEKWISQFGSLFLKFTLQLFAQNMPNGGTDHTHQFDWINGKYALNNTSNWKP